MPLLRVDSAWHVFLLVVVLGLFALPVLGQRGGMTLPADLGQLTDRAETIVRGRVLVSYVEPHPEFRNLHTLVVVLRVERTLKGHAEQTLSFRQFIWDVRDRYDSTGYRKGQEYLLFLNAPTPAGLVSPVGLEQGRFRIERTADGGVSAVNGHANSELLRPLVQQWRFRLLPVSAATRATVERHERGPVALNQIEELVENFVKAGRP